MSGRKLLLQHQGTETFKSCIIKEAFLHQLFQHVRMQLKEGRQKRFIKVAAALGNEGKSTPV